MSRLDELIQELCTEGVEYKELKDVCKIDGGKLNANLSNEYGAYRFFTYDYSDSKFVDQFGWDTEALIVCKKENNDCCRYFNGRFNAFQWMRILHDFDNSVNVYFVKYYLNNFLMSYLRTMPSNQSLPYIAMGTLSKFQVPVPPLEIQREIVRILDQFTELTAELRKELAMRQMQYNYYRDELVTSNSDFIRLGDCCSLVKGETPIQKAMPGKYSLVVTAEERKSSDSYQFDKPSVCVPLVSSRGHGVASLNKVYYQEGKFALGNILCAVTPDNDNELSAKFLYYYLNAKKDTLIVPLMHGGANVSLSIDSLARVKIPLIPLAVQLEVVHGLDIFESYLGELTLEIAARQRQYEYYRDRLLSFPETPSAQPA